MRNQRQTQLTLAIIATTAVGLCLSNVVSSPLAAQEAGSQRVRAHLAAGEFGLARAAAEEAADAAVRDGLLAEVAGAQLRGGARQGAWSSLAGMSDDRRRTAAMDSLLGAPRGGAAGGAALADFDTLIELITTTVASTTWEENGGTGAIEEFPTGVYVDAKGVLRKVDGDLTALARLRRRALDASGPQDVRRTSPLRKVSLKRLEREVQLAWLEGRTPDETMQHLGGIYRLQYVFVYPEARDIVLAGPAGDWQPTPEGHVVHVETGAPVLRLDDLVVLLRQAQREAGVFGCAIKPRTENLRRAQEFLAESRGKALKPGQRSAWLNQLEAALGPQDVEVFGIDPRTRVAKILVEADYRMKLVGIGREPGTLGLTSYLDLAAEGGKDDGELSVLRWWFAMNYDAVRTTPQHDGFAFEGQGVKLLSENELLTARGERIHTGKSDEKNHAFAASFTKHFEMMAGKYPIYAELRNVFDLALAARLIVNEGLADQVDWHQTHFGDPQRYQVLLGTSPTEVHSVVNHRSRGRGQFVAAAAGGVHADPQQWTAAKQLQADEDGVIRHARGYAQLPEQLPLRSWWWD